MRPTKSGGNGAAEAGKCGDGARTSLLVIKFKGPFLLLTPFFSTPKFFEELLKSHYSLRKVFLIPFSVEFYKFTGRTLA